MKVPISGILGEPGSSLYSDFVALQRKCDELAYQNTVLMKENAMLRNGQLQEANLLLSSALLGMHLQDPFAMPMKKAASDLDDASTLAAVSASTSVVTASDDDSTSAATSGTEETAEDDSNTRPDGEPLTTIMMRNLPNNMTRSTLLALIDSQGFEGCYDFLYLPTDFRSQAGLGYSFVNFEDSETASRFRDHFSGFRDWSFQSEKVCTTTWSSTQGRDAHTERYRNSPVMHESMPDEAKPLLFKDGSRVPFPKPTKRLRPPHIVHRAGTSKR